jgi:hypothetical protein
MTIGGDLPQGEKKSLERLNSAVFVPLSAVNFDYEFTGNPGQ